MVQLAPGTDDDHVTNYIKLNGKTVARVKSVGSRLNYNDDITWLHHDNLGSAVAGSDENGNVLWTEKYTPYGISLLNDTDNENQAGYTGHIKDTDTGLTYMQARYYDPVVSRFLSHDPVQFSAKQPLMFNRYAYVFNNPTNGYDPFGLACHQNDVTTCKSSSTVGHSKSSSQYHEDSQPNRVIDTPVSDHIRRQGTLAAPGDEYIEFDTIMQLVDFTPIGGNDNSTGRWAFLNGEYGNMHGAEDSISNSARQRAAVVFPDGEDEYGGYVHAWSSSEYTKQYGAERAKWVMDNHERTGIQRGQTMGNIAADLITNHNLIQLSYQNPNRSSHELTMFAFKHGLVQSRDVNTNPGPYGD